MVYQVTSRSIPVIGSATFSHNGTEFDLDVNYGADCGEIRAEFDQINIQINMSTSLFFLPQITLINNNGF